jgi:hypothetical protein
MASCCLNLCTDQNGQLDGPVPLPPGKESPSHWDSKQGWTYKRIPRLGIEARFLRGLGNLPVTALIVLFRIFFTDEYKNVINIVVDLINIVTL